MSAYAQNYAFIFGKKKPDAKEKVLSEERIREAQKTYEALQAARPKKEKK